LQAALGGFQEQVYGEADALNCGPINAAATVLAQVVDHPATRPDREGIRLILALAARELSQVFAE